MKSQFSQPNFLQSGLKIATVLLVLFAIAFRVMGDYGIDWRAKTDMVAVGYHDKAIARGAEIPKHLQYRGMLFHAASEVAFRATRGFSPQLATSEAIGVEEIYQRWQIKRSLTLAIVFVAYFCTAAIVGILAGIDYAWFGPIILALFPRFWANGFYNAIDIPFASLFSLGTLLGALLLDFYLKRKPRELKLGCNQITLYSILYGILIGLVAGVDIKGLFLFFFLFLAHGLTRFDRRVILQDISRYWLFYLLIGVACAGAIVLIYPAFWLHPWNWAIGVFSHLFDFRGMGGDLLADAGVKIPEYTASNLPLHFLLANPFLGLLSFGTGLIFILANYRIFTNLQRACAVLVLLQIFFFPILAIALESAIDPGMSQFLLTIPGIAAIAAVTLSWMYQKIWTQGGKLAAIALFIVLISPIIFDAIVLHPYQSLYLNRLSNSVSHRESFNLDTRGLSLRDGIEWVNKNAPPNSTLTLGGPTYIGEIFAKPDLKVLELKSALESSSKSYPDYYIAISNLEREEFFPECAIVHRITRQSTTIAMIRDCRHASKSS